MNKNAWPEEEQEELRNLFEEFKNTEGMLCMYTALGKSSRRKFC